MIAKRLMQRERLSWRIRLAFGVGQLAEGIKNSAFGIFLLFYYVSVMGLSGTMAGLALLIALCFDGITDPLMGSLSDSFKSRWGRRHPFMYCAALPFAISFYFLFSPPDNLSPLELFSWLTFFSILTRGLMTIHSVPHLALNAELSDDYLERTTLSSMRNLFSMLGYLCVVAGGFFYFFKAPYVGKAIVFLLAYLGITILAALLCLFPLIYVIVPLLFMLPFFVYNTHLSNLEIIKLAFSLGHKKWGLTFLTLILNSILLYVVILVTCGVGSLFFSFFLYLPQYIIYKKVIGFETPESAFQELDS